VYGSTTPRPAMLAKPASGAATGGISRGALVEAGEVVT